MEDEGAREKLEGKQNTLPSRFVMEPWELFRFLALVQNVGDLRKTPYLG